MLVDFMQLPYSCKMSKKDKLLQRFLEFPTDFRWEELVALLQGLGFEVLSGTGSRRKFFHPRYSRVLIVHEPHPGNIVKRYVLQQIATTLKELGLIHG